MGQIWTEGGGRYAPAFPGKPGVHVTCKPPHQVPPLRLHLVAHLAADRHVHRLDPASDPPGSKHPGTRQAPAVTASPWGSWPGTIPESRWPGKRSGARRRGPDARAGHPTKPAGSMSARRSFSRPSTLRGSAGPGFRSREALYQRSSAFPPVVFVQVTLDQVADDPAGLHGLPGDHGPAQVHVDPARAGLPRG